VRSDRRLLRRLLQNLVSNAVKYTTEGRVLVGCRRRGASLRIDVYDTGIGIPRSKQRIVFTEFHRLDQGAKVARGLGLGLSIVERIARVLDHKVELSSAVGRGSHFCVEVPLAPAAARLRGSGGQQPLDVGQLTGMAVLCIDNDAKILDGMTTLLGGWGCRVIAATDLAAATAALREEQTAPAGLLVDYHLDHGDGIAAIAELRGTYGAELPAILVTADRSAGVREAAHAHRIQVVNKPIKPAALRALLAQWRIQQVAAAE
jgi:CheY-like chemotaxis protein